VNDDRGFVKVDCPRCANPDVWLKCESCKKADHFLIRAEADGAPPVVDCDCSARFTFATCTCGEQVPMARLRFVRWDRGPKQLADLEIAWERIAAIVLGGVGVILVGLWALWR
jgi:hypothetical protein